MPRSPEAQIDDMLNEAAHEFAAEEGWIRYMSATRVDPGCYDRSVDVEYELQPVPDEDTGEPSGDLQARVVAKVGGTVLFERDYFFWVRPDGFVAAPDYEDV